MNVKQLLEQISPDTVIRVIQSKYPEETERIESGYYENLIEKIKKAKTVENEVNRTIHVEYTKDFGETNPDFIWNASYSTHKRYNHKYALKFATVEEIASAYILKKDLEEQSVAQYFAHLFYELAHCDVLDGTEEEFNCVDDKFAIC